jgi:hypothetical protein
MMAMTQADEKVKSAPFLASAYFRKSTTLCRFVERIFSKASS